MQKNLLIFDLDNTLLPFKRHWETANHEVFSKSQITEGLDYDLFMQLFRNHDNKLWKLHIQQLLTLDELRQQRFINTLNDLDINVNIDQAQEYFKVFFQSLLNKILPDLNLNNYLLNLKESYEIALLTNGKIVEQKEKIKRMKLDEVFHERNIFISDEIGYEKPESEAFNHVLNALGRSSNQAIYIGDSWANDIQGSIDIGMNAVWITSDSKHIENSNSNVISIPTVFDLNNALMEFEQYEISNS